MSASGLEVLDKTLQTTHIWLSEIGETLGSDKQRQYQAFRAVLFALRDRLTVEEAFLSAQLPMLVRGIFWESYRPVHKPERYRSLDEFLEKVSDRIKYAAPIHPEDCAPAAQTPNVTPPEGQLNIGQLCRDHFGDHAALIGFSMHGGTVAAASDWGGDVEIKRVRPSHRDSYERLCHDADVPRFVLDLRPGENEALRRRLLEPRLERFIGVIYRPETELLSHYSEASLAQQFDAFVWFDETSAVTPLGPQHARPGAPETYPFGL